MVVYYDDHYITYDTAHMSESFQQVMLSRRPTHVNTRAGSQVKARKHEHVCSPEINS